MPPLRPLGMEAFEDSMRKEENAHFLMLFSTLVFSCCILQSYFGACIAPLTGFVWLVSCIFWGIQRHFTSEGRIMAVGDEHMFPGFLTPVLTQLFFPKPPTTFLTCFCRG